MNFLDPRLWLEAAVLLITAINSGVLFVMRPGREAKAAVQALADRLEAERIAADDRAAAEQHKLALQVQHLEDRIAHMPTDEELATLRGDVHAITRQLEGQLALLERIDRQQTLIQQHLLNKH